MRKRGIFIELTALLDVILLMLFLLLGQMQNTVAKAEETAREATQEAAQTAREAAREAEDAGRRALSLQRQLDDAKEQLSRNEREQRTLGIVAEHSAILTVSMQDGAARRIRVEPEGEAAVYLVLREESETSRRLYEALRDQIEASGQETVFLVFQYDRSTIYHAEYELISRVIRELKADAPSLGVALNVIETDLTEKEMSSHG